jgi:hypothetical protein
MPYTQTVETMIFEMVTEIRPQDTLYSIREFDNIFKSIVFCFRRITARNLVSGTRSSAERKDN